jgi:hypothetical protein
MVQESAAAAMALSTFVPFHRHFLVRCRGRIHLWLREVLGERATVPRERLWRQRLAFFANSKRLVCSKLFIFNQLPYGFPVS